MVLHLLILRQVIQIKRGKIDQQKLTKKDLYILVNFGLIVKFDTIFIHLCPVKLTRLVFLHPVVTRPE